MFNKSPEMPFCSSLKITPSSQTLLKVLENMSKKTLLTSSPSSKDKLQAIYVMQVETSVMSAKAIWSW